MQRNLFDIFEKKVQTFLKKHDEPINIEDIDNIEIYIKTAELMLRNERYNYLMLNNFIIALAIKQIDEQQRKSIDSSEINPKTNLVTTSKVEPENKAIEITHQNITLRFVKQINELTKFNKELKDKNFKINEELDELKNILLEKNKEVDNLKKQLELADHQLEDLLKQIQDLSVIKKLNDEKENEPLKKSEIDKIINKNKNGKTFGSWSLTKTLSKFNQDKANSLIATNPIKNVPISPEKLEFFQNSTVDRSTILATEKNISELGDTITRKNILS